MSFSHVIPFHSKREDAEEPSNKTNNTPSVQSIITASSKVDNLKNEELLNINKLIKVIKDLNLDQD